MAEKSNFFDSVNADRVHFASDWALHLSKYFTNGIFDNGLRVEPHDGMNITVNVGDANINGYRYINDSQKVISVKNADGILNRIDNIVVRLDLPNRQITTEIVTGAFAENAFAPVLIRGTSVYDIRIAKINIPAGTTEITSDLIEDTRFNKNDCGNVICAVQNPNFSSVLEQYTALWEKLINRQTQEFTNWFNDMKDILNEETAIQLNEKIEQNTSKINTNTGNIATNTTDITNLETQVNKLLNVQLYKNTSGTAGTVTLNQSANNFNEIVIICWRKNSHFFDCVVKNPNGKKVNLSSGYLANNTTFQINSKMVQISGNTITVVTEGYANITHNAPNAVGEQEVIYITEVVGRYKK